MALILIEPPRGDVGEELQRALEFLKKASINARRRSTSLQSTTLLQAEDSDAERALRVFGLGSITAG
jgi:hypothetical protein